MGTYYRWNKYELVYLSNRESDRYKLTINGGDTVGYFSNIAPILNQKTGYYSWGTASDYTGIGVGEGKSVYDYAYVACKPDDNIDYAYVPSKAMGVRSLDKQLIISNLRSESTIMYRYYSTKTGAGDLIEYVYSTSSTTYPNSDIQGDYWYSFLHFLEIIYSV